MCINNGVGSIRGYAILGWEGNRYRFLPAGWEIMPIFPDACSEMMIPQSAGTASNAFLQFGAAQRGGRGRCLLYHKNPISAPAVKDRVAASLICKGKPVIVSLAGTKIPTSQSTFGLSFLLQASARSLSR